MRCWFGLLTLVAVVGLAAVERHPIYDPAVLSPVAGEPLFVGRQPNNEAKPLVLADGEIRLYHSAERMGPLTRVIRSRDDGHTWSLPEDVFVDEQTWQYPRTLLRD
ncbi:MAG: hypothetical protein ACYTF0_09650, partial [Planctomycetota bacterium]